MKRYITVIVSLVLLLYGFSVSADDISISAKAAVLINADNMKIIYERNSDELLPMASTTKIMTALIVIEKFNASTEITVGDEVLEEGTNMGLKPGDILTAESLLYGLILASGNDAANALAVAVGKSIDGFVGMMNSKAESMGLNSTHFDTPSGLDGENHYTTAYELAVITAEALKQPLFRQICSTLSKTVTVSDREIALNNHNRLLKEYNGAYGVKTGYTSSAGRCLVSAAERENVRLIAVTLNDKNDWKDHKALLDYGFDTEKPKEVIQKGGCLRIPVFDGERETLNAEYGDTVLSVTDGDEITFVTVTEPIITSAEKGDILGEVRYFVNSRYVSSVNIYASESIPNDSLSGFFFRMQIVFLKMLKCI